MTMRGLDPQSSHERKPTELLAPNPLADARQSGRLWLKCKKILNQC